MLKIDRSFISKIIVSDQDLVIGKAIIEMSNNLGIEIVAEDIENHETAAALVNLKCKLGQGYLWSKPMPASEFINFIETGSN
ncbi:MAG: EAL domain-containing protein (putative c-di-GMP-specific phosphodiesterase class I) [Glaciecola sp.]|jgi:EAL domain-containing protein (putative c-di-GMP-specific phosphodiesterase class I)